MSVNYIERLAAKSTLDTSLVEENWNWPAPEALETAAEGGDYRAINRDLELYSRTRFKSCRVVKLLRDAEDAAWELKTA